MTFSRIRSLFVGVVAIFVLAVLAIAPAANAQQSSLNGYGGDGAQPQAAAAEAPSADTGGGSLPFTGLDLALVVSGGLVLIGAGAVIARFVPREDQA